MADVGPILYIASELPKLSETFVYREILALRAKGIDVRTASVHAPGDEFTRPELVAMKRDAEVVYQGGVASVLVDVLLETMSHPVPTAMTMLYAKVDPLFAKGLSLSGRLKAFYQYLAGISLARRVRHLGIRHIHAHFAHVPATIAMAAAKQLDIPFSFTGHANDLFRHRSLLEEKLQRASFVACISTWHNHWYGSVATAKRDNRPIIRCGVDLNEFAPEPQTPGLITSVARLVEKKGLDTLIEACAILRDRGIEFQCKIAGDGPMRQDLASMITQHNLADRVELLGAMPNEQVRELVASSSVFCLPCRDDSSGDRDGIPVALMEAMACRVATVSGDLPAIRELIEDRVSGRLVPGGDAETLAGTLEELLARPELRESLGVQGRMRIAQEFDLAVNADRMIKALRTLGGLA